MGHYKKVKLAIVNILKEANGPEMGYFDPNLGPKVSTQFSQNLVVEDKSYLTTDGTLLPTIQTLKLNFLFLGFCSKAFS